MDQINRLIYGKSNLQGIVGCEITDNICELFVQEGDKVKSVFKPNKFWLMANKPLDNGFRKLNGDQFYKYIKYYETRDSFLSDRVKYYRNSTYSIYNSVEAAQVHYGFTFYKGLKLQNITVLSFDIETTSLEHNQDAKVLLIANTLRRNNQIIRKMFCYDQFASQGEMIQAWCKWVREVDPSIMVAHNGIIYDFPYLSYVAAREGISLDLGRDASAIQFDNRESKFRKDGSQFYSYKKIKIYGREICDTFFLSLKYDVARKYENYKLKQIIKQEGLEVKDRQFYDGDLIRHNYTNPIEWEKIKKYAEHDGDDSLALFDLMAPSQFYFTQSIPKSFQSVIESATGSQLNAMMIRSYLQDGYSLPLDSDAQEYEGAISLGNPGVYHNVLKFDVASLYPSIILTHEVYDKIKDPNQHFLKIARYFTEQRLNNKHLAKETGDRYYKDLEQAQKIAINSLYGFLGATGLLFNSPRNASFITEKGREILTKSIDWSDFIGFKLVNADTDSISISDGEYLSEEDRKALLKELNSLYPSSIRWENDGYYPYVLVVKAKNYYLVDEKNKITIKGSALKASMKERALQQFIKDFIQSLLNKDDLLVLYHRYVSEILKLKDITPWCSKKTVTDKVLNPERTNEQKVKDALDSSDEEFQEGDKAFFYFDTSGNLKLAQNWNPAQPDHDPYKLIEKLWKTAKVFETVVDIEQFPKYHLKTERKFFDATKLKVKKVPEDLAFKFKKGQVIELLEPINLLDDIVNLGGAHFKTSQLKEYFSVCV